MLPSAQLTNTGVVSPLKGNARVVFPTSAPRVSSKATVPTAPRVLGLSSDLWLLPIPPPLKATREGREARKARARRASRAKIEGVRHLWKLGCRNPFYLRHAQNSQFAASIIHLLRTL